MLFVDPFCAQLSATSAQSVRENAVRTLKVQCHIQALPPAETLANASAREFLLEQMVSSNEVLLSPALSGVPGDTHEERRKNFDEQESIYEKQETALFYADPELWWQHRAKESYDYHKYMDRFTEQVSNKAKIPSGCVVPIAFFSPFGCWATLRFLCS